MLILLKHKQKHTTQTTRMILFTKSPSIKKVTSMSIALALKKILSIILIIVIYIKCLLFPVSSKIIVYVLEIINDLNQFFALLSGLYKCSNNLLSVF